MIYPGSILTEFERNDAFKILPVGGVPDTRTVNCHEDDGIVSYQSDQFGFNNPAGTWQEQVTFAFVGDSYVHGFCMQNPNTFVGIFRQAFPSTVNIAIKVMAHIQLAGVREYIPIVKPEICYFGHSTSETISKISKER